MGAKLYQPPQSLEDYFRRDPKAFEVIIDATVELEELFTIEEVKRCRTEMSLGNWGFSRLTLFTNVSQETEEDLIERFYKMGYHALFIHHKVHLNRVYVEEL